VTDKPLTPAELSEIERTGSLREVTAERIVATVREVERWQSLRPEVQAFALAMEEQLRANDAQKGTTWQSDQTTWWPLWEHFCQEAVELHDAIHSGDRAQILHEAADAANLAMMLADNLGALSS
jgi:NTP pyrophosphatase (non-canonical NTP hydrolase)